MIAIFIYVISRFTAIFDGVRGTDCIITDSFYNISSARHCRLSVVDSLALNDIAILVVPIRKTEPLICKVGDFLFCACR